MLGFAVASGYGADKYDDNGADNDDEGHVARGGGVAVVDSSEIIRRRLEARDVMLAKVLRTMNFTLKMTRNLVLRTRNFAFQMMNFVLAKVQVASQEKVRLGDF